MAWKPTRPCGLQFLVRGGIEARGRPRPRPWGGSGHGVPEDYMYEDSSEDGDGAMSETSRVTVSCAEEGAGSDEFDASAACDHDVSREVATCADARVLSDGQGGLDDAWMGFG